MTGKSARRLQLEASLAEDPGDTFLRYGLALQCLRDGDRTEGRERLHALIAEHPEQVAAYQQLGQAYLEDDQLPAAHEVLVAGIAQARTQGADHAAAEMLGLLELTR